VTSIVACGDVGACRADCASIFSGSRCGFAAADLSFAQLETTISARGSKAPNARLAMRAPEALAATLREVGIDVVSFAGNHCLDFGYEAFNDTLRHLREAGVRSCGAGENLAAARDPVFCEAGSYRVAFIAASSILPEGYAAGVDKAGCAPMRALTVYEPTEPDQPGTAPRVLTFARPEDLSALAAAVRSARAAADFVLVSLHWGVHMIPFVLADYQSEVAHALIDAGADAVLGHHPHILKAIELYRCKPIYYSLGNFAIEQPHVWDPAILRTESFRNLVSLNPQWSLSKRYTLPENTRATGLAKLLIEKGGRIECRFCPAWVDDDSTPQMLRAGDSRFGLVREFLERSTRAVGLDTRFDVDGDELVLS
jgi:poly-gamma-glutamate capsule biosynthesis protein CapA/YwtB (metallophosphatase superfamily)